MDDEPELYIIKPSDWPGADEWRAEHERQKAESRARYLDLVTAEMDAAGADDPAAKAEALFGLLFTHGHDHDHDCGCGCHPHLPTSDFHDYGFSCPCLQTPEERRASMEEGDVIAEGTTGAAGYGQTPVERAAFIVTIIREHLLRTACDVHVSGTEALRLRLGVSVRFCPACGERLDCAR